MAMLSRRSTKKLKQLPFVTPTLGSTPHFVQFETISSVIMSYVYSFFLLEGCPPQSASKQDELFVSLDYAVVAPVVRIVFYSVTAVIREKYNRAFFLQNSQSDSCRISLEVPRTGTATYRYRHRWFCLANSLLFAMLQDLSSKLAVSSA